MPSRVRFRAGCSAIPPFVASIDSPESVRHQAGEYMAKADPTQFALRTGLSADLNITPVAPWPPPAAVPGTGRPYTSGDPGEEPGPLDRLSGRWWVCHTRARNEKALSSELARAGVQHFLPLVSKRRRYGTRTRCVDFPLFPGYLFLCGDLGAREFALRTNRLAHVLEVPDQDQFRSDLNRIYRVVHSDEPADLYPRLHRGTRCRVRRGSLAGLEGVVLRRPGLWRVYVGVEFLGQSAELEIDPEFLELLD